MSASFTDQNQKEEGSFLNLSATTPQKQVWAVGGGKGGVGKSLISANLAITLTQLGHRVTAIDLDLGCANLHTCLGVDIPTVTLSDFFTKRISKIEDALLTTPIRNLNMISGAQDSLGIANLKHTQKSKLLEDMRSIDTDYLIFDLGAGTSYNTLDFFLNADVGILVLLPEPTSIENTYRFIKSAYYRKLKLAESLFEIRPLIDMAMDQKNSMGIRSPADLVREASKYSSEMGNALREEIAKFSPRLVINQTRTQSDIDIGFSIKSVCKKYFGIDLNYVGYLDYDSAVWQSVRRKRPLCLEFPNSKLASNFQRITKQILQKDAQPRVVRPEA